MKITVFEGTPEEYKQVASELGGQAITKVNQERTAPTIKEAYRAMLKRAPIHAGQRDMYRILAEGELSKNTFYQLMERSDEQMRGVLGALGRRIAGTPEIGRAGLAENINAIIDWNKTGENTIRLKSDFLEVLREEELI